MTGFCIHTYMYQCPVYWQNFINHLQTEGSFDEVPLDVINQALSYYGGRWVQGRNATSVEFDNNAGFTMFVLRWA